MADLTKDTPRRERTVRNGGQPYVLTNAVVVYRGSLIGLVRSTGRATKWSDTAGLDFLGFADKGATGDTSASPPVDVLVDDSGKVLENVAVTGASAITDNGDWVYAADDGSFTLTPTTNVKAIGVILKWHTSTTCTIRLFTPEEYAAQLLAADLVTLTDSTGKSGTHDDTLAATTVPTITATNPAAPTAYAAVVNMTDPVTKAEGEAVSAALATLRSEVATYETAISALVVDVAAILALLTVMTQNQSDTAQKVIELVAALNAAQ